MPPLNPERFESCSLNDPSLRTSTTQGEVVEPPDGALETMMAESVRSSTSVPSRSTSMSVTLTSERVNPEVETASTSSPRFEPQTCEAETLVAPRTTRPVCRLVRFTIWVLPLLPSAYWIPIPLSVTVKSVKSSEPMWSTPSPESRVLTPSALALPRTSRQVKSMRSQAKSVIVAVPQRRSPTNESYTVTPSKVPLPKTSNAPRALLTETWDALTLPPDSTLMPPHTPETLVPPTAVLLLQMVTGDAGVPSMTMLPVTRMV